MSLAFVKAVASLGGISLRDRGAVYFVPAQHLFRFACIRDAFRKSGQTQINEAHIQVTTESIKAVKTALENEILAEVEQIQADLQDEPSKTVLSNRLERIKKIRQTLNLYKPILSDTLDELTSAIDGLETSEAFLTLGMV